MIARNLAPAKCIGSQRAAYTKYFLKEVPMQIGAPLLLLAPHDPPTIVPASLFLATDVFASMPGFQSLYLIWEGTLHMTTFGVESGVPNLRPTGQMQHQTFKAWLYTYIRYMHIHTFYFFRNS